MVRRDFLKLSGLMTAALVVQTAPAATAFWEEVQVESAGRLYRGTRHGRIYTSDDAGASWQLHSDFGADLAVWDMSADSRGVHARLGFAGYGIDLSLMPNGRNWHTA